MSVPFLFHSYFLHLSFAATEQPNSFQYSNRQSIPFRSGIALANEQALNIGESYGERQQVKPYY